MDFGRQFFCWTITLILFSFLAGCQGSKGAGRGGDSDNSLSFGPCLPTNNSVASVTGITGGSFVATVTVLSSTNSTVDTPIPVTPGKVIEISGSGFECDTPVEISFGASSVTATPITVNAGQIIFAFPAIGTLGLDYDATPDARVMDLVVNTTGGSTTVVGAFYLPKILLVNDEAPIAGSNTSTLSIWTTAMGTLVGATAFDIITSASATAPILSENEVVIWFTGGNDGADFFTGGGTPPSPSTTERTAIETFITTPKTPFPGVDISGFCLTSSLTMTLADSGTFPTVAGSAGIVPPPTFGIYSGWFDTTGSSFFAAFGVEQMFYNFAYYYGAYLSFGTNAWYVVNTPYSGSILSTLPDGYAFTCSTPIWEYFTSACANVFPMNSLYSHMDAPADFLGSGAGTGLSAGFTPVWSFVAAYYGTTVETPPCSFTIASGGAGFGGVQPDDFPKSAMHSGVSGPTNVVFSGIPFEALLANDITTGAGGYPLAGPGNMGSPEIFATFLANLSVLKHKVT